MLKKSKIINITLKGTECKISNISGYYAEITNHTGNIIFASTKPQITPGSDDVMAIFSGQKRIIAFPFHSKDLYLLGTGDVSILGTDYPSDNYIVPNNPNLLINPDFRINQRGRTEYTTDGYTVDGWLLYNSFSATNGKCIIKPTNDGIEIANNTDVTISFASPLENASEIANDNVTISSKINGEIVSVTGVPINTFHSNISTNWHVGYGGHPEILVAPNTTIKLNWIKLELGSFATPFTSPDISTELLKCQRYYQIHTVGDIKTIDLRPSMCNITPTVTMLSNGNYAYSTEI